MRRLVQRAYPLTIWHSDAIPLSEWKYRNLKRVLLPLIDLAFILVGVGGALNTVPALSEIYPDSVVDMIMLAFAASAFGAFVGVAIPRFWILELVSKAAIFGSLVAYAATLWYLIETVPSPNGSGRVYLLAFVIIPIGVVVWRMSLLASEWQDRRQKRAREQYEEFGA